MILLDTNVIIAAARTADTNHHAAADFLDGVTEPLLVAPTVLAEVCYLLGEWGGPEVEADFLSELATAGRDALALVSLELEDVARMAELVMQYADLRLGGTDASVVALAERLGVSKVATFDPRHFTVVRPRHVDALDLLPA